MLVKEPKDPYGYDWTDWQKFEPSSEKLKELVKAMDTGMPYTTSVGFKIYAPGGEDPTGIMYSRKWDATGPDIRFKDGNLIVIKPRKFSGAGGAP